MPSLGRVTLLWIAGSCLAAPPAREAERRLVGLPPYFEPGPGQFGSEILYRARLPGYLAEFHPSEMRMELAGASRSLKLVFEGASPKARIEAEGRLNSVSHYFLGDRPENWRSRVPHYRALRYRAIYPGVDALFYGAGEGLEYDLELAAGADPARIRLRFDGADEVRLTSEGDLEIVVAGRRLIQKKPAAYQAQAGGRRTVGCRYRLLGRRRVAVELEAYRRDRPLVIDPVLVYATYLGAGSNDAIIGVRTDAQGMIYVAGYTGSGDLTTTPDSVQTAAAGQRDIFVAKLDPAREGLDSLIYFTYLGGAGADTPTAMALDAEGNVYLTGWTQSTDFPLGGNAPQIQRGGETGQDAFVVKLNPAIPGPIGLLFSTYLGGEQTDTGYSIDVDSEGLLYVAGVTKSEEFPLAGRPIQRGRWGEQDAFLAWLDPNAPDPASALRYSSYLGGEFNDEGRAVAALGRGVAAVAGATFSEQYHVTPGGFRTSYQGGGDVFFTVLDMNKPEYDALLYSTYLGGAGNEEPRRMARDPQGRLVMVGYTLSSDYPVTEGAFQPVPRRAGQVFVSVLDTTKAGAGALIYSTYFGGTGGEVAYDAVVDRAGRIYLTGYTLSADFPVTARAFQKEYGGGVEAFCAVLDPAAPPQNALLYASYLGRTGVNVGYGVAVAPDGTIYIGGSVQDRAFPVTGNALQQAHGGGLADGFVVALKPDETGLGSDPPQQPAPSP